MSWDIILFFDTELEEMIDFKNPESRGNENHRKYDEQILKN